MLQMYAHSNNKTKKKRVPFNVFEWLEHKRGYNKCVVCNQLDTTAGIVHYKYKKNKSSHENNADAQSTVTVETFETVSLSSPEKKLVETPTRSNGDNCSTYNTPVRCSQNAKMQQTETAIQTSPISPSINQILHTNLPLNSKVRIEYAKLTKKILQFSPDNNTLNIKTGGQPLVFKKVTQPRLRTISVCTKTKRNRVNLMNKFRQNLSGRGREYWNIHYTLLQQESGYGR